MPAMLRIDTLKFAKRMTDAGMDQRQAEALVQGLSEADTSEFATRTDIGGLKAEIGDLRAETRAGFAGLRAEFADLRAEFADLRAGTRSDIAGLRAEAKADIAELKAELFRFLYVQAMGVVGLTVGLTVALIKLLPT